MSNQEIRNQISALADKWNGAEGEGGLFMLAIDGDDYNICCFGNRPILAATLAALMEINPPVEDVLLRTGELCLRRKRLINRNPLENPFES